MTKDEVKKEVARGTYFLPPPERIADSILRTFAGGELPDVWFGPLPADWRYRYR